jgi:glucokinase
MRAALENDQRVVLTLDAGGTNFVFSAMQGAREVASPLRLPSHAHDRAACLAALMEGFGRVREQAAAPAAISFAFPGPADYAAGIIGDPNNFPSFRGGVALGPMLENRFGVPVFINNDGDLFAYGEAIAGFLPYVNGLLAEAASPKRFRNLFGATLGTGFGGGIVRDGQLYIGDNAAAGEVWALRNKLDHEHCAEDAVSIRGVRLEYARRTGTSPAASPEPLEIFEIAAGRRAGDPGAAREAFRRLGEAAGDALANVATLLDGLIVIGGGLSGAAPLFLPALVEEMNGRLLCGPGFVPRTVVRAFNLEDPQGRERFLTSEVREIEVPGSQKRLLYDPLKRVGVGLSRLGASRAVAVGAYAFALDALDGRRALG